MITSTFVTSPGSAQLTARHAVYASAREGVSGSLTGTVGGTINEVGQFVSGDFRCMESFLRFETGGIPDDVGVLAARLYWYGHSDQSATDFTAELRLHSWGPTSGTEDWVPGSQLASKPLVATFASSAFPVGSFGQFTEVGTMLRDSINRTGTTEFILCSDRHRIGNQPTGNEYVTFYARDNVSGYHIRLAVDYDPDDVDVWAAF